MTDLAPTRARLLQATRDAIRDVGIGGATAREISSRAKANLAAIPYYFGTKDALVVEALLAEARELVRPVLELFGSERPAAERAAEAVEMLTGLFERRVDQVPVYLTALAAASHSDEVAAGLAGLWDDVRQAVAEDISRQLGQGRLPSWVDPQAMAALILSLVNGVVIASVVDPRGPDHTAVAAQFLQLLLAAIATPPQGPV